MSYLDLPTAQNRGFVVPVDDRTRATLEPLIMQYIAPGSIINHDCWAPYDNIPNLPVNPPYQERPVNHSQTFVAPNGTTTNHAERYI